MGRTADFSCKDFYANFLRLNVQKCEVITFDSQGGRADMRDVVEVGGAVIPRSSEAKCLGFWWKGDLFATRAVEEGISKARRAFFLFGRIGTFQDELNPASSKSVIETCVMPVLLYGYRKRKPDQPTQQLFGRASKAMSQVAQAPLEHHCTCGTWIWSQLGQGCC